DGSHAWRMWVESSLVYVAIEDNQIIGVALAFPSLDGSFCLHKIFVDSTYRGQGVGSALMEHLLQAIDDLGSSAFLTVDPRNSSAIELYAKFGFSDKKFVEAFYGEGEDRYILRRKK
ncbi:MAG: GNAT family N-acetyltransferase, partial [Campylobacterota bacterium]|nr:GNAT family N-acetyltransferase [Campylobacterota bacterium]